MRNSPVVEGAWADDLAAVLALVRAADLPTEGIAPGFPDAYAVVRDGAEVVAVAGLETYGTYGLLRSLAVARSQRGAGLGRLLVEDRLRTARERDLAAVYLLTTTAATFFHSLGFADVPRASAPASLQTSIEFSMVCPASAACLVRTFR